MEYNAIVVAHVYYEWMWEQLAKCIDCIGCACRCDVIVTVPAEVFEKGVLSDLENRIRSIPNVRIVHVGNRGFDIGPFIECLNDLSLDDYDFIVKLHTKRDVHGFADGRVNGFHLNGSKWRRLLLSFCSSRKAVLESIRRLTDDDDVGMVAASEIIVSSGDYYEKVYPEATSRALAITGSTHGCFVAGTMFMANARLFKPLQGRWSREDFASSSGKNRCEDGDTMLPYVIERLLGYIVYKQGWRIADFRKYRLFYPVKMHIARFVTMVLRFVRRTCMT